MPDETAEDKPKAKEKGAMASFVEHPASGYALIGVAGSIAVLFPFLPIKTILPIVISSLLGVPSSLVITPQDFTKFSAIQIQLGETEQVLIIPKGDSARIYIGGSKEIISTGGVISVEANGAGEVDEPTKKTLEDLKHEIKKEKVGALSTNKAMANDAPTEVSVD